MLPVSKRYGQTWLPGIFNDFFANDWGEKSGVTAPAINVLENERSYDIELAAPGMTRQDFQVSLNESGDLVINMEKKNQEEKKNGHFLRREFSYSKFKQTMILPEDVEKDKITASVCNGVLKINIPKIQKQDTAPMNKIIDIQ